MRFYEKLPLKVTDSLVIVGSKRSGFMPQAIIKGKLTRAPYSQKLPEPKKKTKKISNSALSPPLEKYWKYQPVLLNGERIISCRRTRVAKKQDDKKTYEIDETPYGKINVINDDLTWRGIRGAHHSGRLFLTNRRLVHIVKQGWDPWAKYAVDLDRPLSTLQTAAVEKGDGWKRKFIYPEKRLTVQYYKGDVDMFGDTIFAQRGGPPVDEQKETSKERELRKQRERLELKLEKLKLEESKLREQNKLKLAEQKLVDRKQIEHELEKLKLKENKLKEFKLEERTPEIALEKRRLKERGLVAAAGRRETFLEREPEKRRFHIRGDVDEFLKEIKKRAEIE